MFSICFPRFPGVCFSKLLTMAVNLNQPIFISEWNCLFLAVWGLGGWGWGGGGGGGGALGTFSVQNFLPTHLCIGMLPDQLD